MEATFVIVGGGIAGVTCATTLGFLQSEESVILISESALIKTACNVRAITKTLVSFDVEEKNSNSLSELYPNISVLHDSLIEIDDESFTIKTASGVCIKYKYLCLCMGARPKLIPQAKNNSYIFGIRDTDSVENFIKKLKNSKKVAVVGNGGIASELVHKIKNTEIFWIIKDKHVTATFVDPGASEFLLSATKITKDDTVYVPVKRMRYSEEGTAKSGAALGPDWYNKFNIIGAACETLPDSVSIRYESEVADLKINENSEHPVELILTTGETLHCDLVVSATGVKPRSEFKSRNKLELSEDGGIKVNAYMQTSLPNIYAAGDLCTANWDLAKHWFQMKLWTQAHQMGAYAAKSMFGAFNNEEVLQDFCFEIFAHTTRLFGYKVILLGLFNGQKLGRDYEILLRMTKGVEYVKFVLQNNRLQGAILIGDTDLEEMCENLILNQLDLSPYGDDILNPDIDIEDYFD